MNIERYFFLQKWDKVRLSAQAKELNNSQSGRARMDLSSCEDLALDAVGRKSASVKGTGVPSSGMFGGKGGTMKVASAPAPNPLKGTHLEGNSLMSTNFLPLCPPPYLLATSLLCA